MVREASLTEQTGFHNPENEIKQFVWTEHASGHSGLHYPMFEPNLTRHAQYKDRETGPQGLDWRVWLWLCVRNECV